MLRGWFRGERSMHLDGRHYRVIGARSGPPPAHPIGLWIGGYKPRMLRLTGRLGDGWLLTVGYLDLSDAHGSHRVIAEAARRAGRDPGDVRRVLNAGVEGPTNTGAGQLARLTADYRFDTVLVTVPDEDPVGFIHRLGEDAAPAARAEVG